jgi:hypothetical protein
MKSNSQEEWSVSSAPTLRASNRTQADSSIATPPTTTNLPGPGMNSAIKANQNASIQNASIQNASMEANFEENPSVENQNQSVQNQAADGMSWMKWIKCYCPWWKLSGREELSASIVLIQNSLASNNASMEGLSIQNERMERRFERMERDLSIQNERMERMERGLRIFQNERIDSIQGSMQGSIQGSIQSTMKEAWASSDSSQAAEAATTTTILDEHIA